jgi:di/tricarboxylate transporter
MALRLEIRLHQCRLVPLGFFSWAPFGLATLAVSILFMLFLGRDWLSRQRSGEQAATEVPKVYDVINSYALKDRWHRLQILAGSPLIGQSVSEVYPSLSKQYGLDLLGIEKHQHGKAQFLSALPETVFEIDDVIFTLVDEEQIPALIEAVGCRVTGALSERQRQQALQDIGVAEVMLAPESKSIGNTVADLDLDSTYHLSILALRHRGQPLTEHLAEQTLDFGDTLLVGGNWEDINRLRGDRQNYLLLTLPAEYQERLPDRGRAPIAVGILVAMVVVMVLQVLPNAAAALIAALAMIAGGCVRLDSIYRVISWTTLVLIAGMLPLATALTKTGATTLMANGLVRMLGPLGPSLMLGVVFLVTALVGLFISNAVTAVLIAPVAIEASQALQVSPHAFVMTVAIACSASFVTPVSAPTNMLVMEPGGFRFGDYVKVGLPMLLLTMLITVALARAIYLSG